MEPVFFEYIPELSKSPEMRELLLEYGTTRSYEPGEVILEEHARIRAIPIVTKGTIKVMQTDDDYREMVLYYLQPGESCIMSFLGGMHDEKSKIRAVAEERSELLLVSVENMMKLIREHPMWLNYVFRLYHKRFEELLEVVNAVSFKKMDERLLAYLQRKAEVSGSRVLYLTHEQISIELATARVVVSRLLKQMEKEGLVELHRNKLILRA
ncbi:MAG: Crp/Fnr family transcriptional regulator [Candidatus Cyclonatronum sp.]|uniref:Crp/Fnr family transcriptional regulator n=1 Tax=Cyclonatronum sp. TaxID=3024185 RepID=UPI0025BF3A95|nr:Crp/Fnr family transcriptional regulator [Cyclonatronum sp.]MCH8485516.1 Crp/Fnr family transcriptional regulator [Cyclonatronum sp.]